MFPTNAHYLLHKIFTILAYLFRSHGQLYKNNGILSHVIHISTVYGVCGCISVKSYVCVNGLRR
jgi:hypothetical protein